MTTQTTVARAVRFSLLALVSASVTPQVFAADEAAVIDDKVERIEVTGSRIKRTDLENASPIVVVSAADIEKGGFNSVQDVLGNLSQNSGGSMTQQEVHGFTPAASAVNLRGVGAGRVLTLINGKRVPKYPFGAGGTDSFVDTANIPLGAIERIEILTTGASAIYGSDAMGGVINIILKKDVEQSTFKYRHSDTFDGGLQNNQFSFMTGVSSDKANLTFFAEYEDRQALKASDRPEWGTDIIPGNYYASYSSYGANLVDSNGKLLKSLSAAECDARGYVMMSNGKCGFDRSAQRDFSPEQKRYSTMINLTKDLNDNHQLYSRLDYTHASTYTEIESATVGDDFMFNVSGDNVTIVDELNGLSQVFDKNTAFGGDFAGAADGDYYYTRRMSELGPRTSDFETNNFSFLLGSKGYLTDTIEYDTSWSIARQTVDSTTAGSPTYQSMWNYLTAGTNGNSLLDVISPDDAAMLDFQGGKKGQSTLSSFNAGISGDAFELPAGTVAYAVGVEYGKEWFYDKSDSFTSNGGVIGKGGSSAQGEREQYAGYAEVAVPVIENLTVTLAGRYDYYDDLSDVGGQFSPQVAVEYRPIDNLLLRGLYAETFRAPDMQRLFGEPTAAYSTVIDTPTCEAAGGTGPACEKIDSQPITIGANPELEAETGKNYNLGMVWDYNDLNLTLDYWIVEIDNLVNSPSAQYILDHSDAFADKIFRDASGKLIQVNTQAINMSSQETSGIDFSVGYRYETSGYGDVTARLEGTYLLKWEEQLTPDSEPLDLIDGDGSAPQIRGNLNLGWNYDDFATNLLIKYTDSMNGQRKEAFINNGLADKYAVTIDSHVEVNWAASYMLTDAIKFSGGINNIFDAGPEIDETQNSWPHYPRSYYNVVGREYYLAVEMNF